MRLIVHADDFGLSRGITDRIIEIRHSGCLDRTSIVPNGTAFEYAAAFLVRHPDLECAVHLNLVEGKPLSPPAQVPLLVNEQGCLKHSFISLWLLHLLHPRRRKELTAQIEQECSAQISRVNRQLNLPGVTIDSHRYLHLLPFVARLILDRAEQWHIRAFRLVREPLCLCRSLKSNLAILFSMAMLKRWLLNFMSWKLRPRLEHSRIFSPDLSFGVLHSGKVSVDLLFRMLNTEQRKRRTAVELVFHPGPAHRWERSQWAASPRLESFYYAPDRLREYETLLSPAFKNCISLFRRAEL